MTYKLTLEKAYSKYGADIGRGDDTPADPGVSIKLHLTRMRIDAGGYDTGGAYWGIGDHMYCAEGETDTESARIFVRAKNRQDAKAKILRKLPNASFYR